jgi:hypothetical protein
MLLGSGVLCAMPTMGSMSDRGASEMTDMAMEGAPAPAPTTPRAPAHDQTPCHLPWAPAGCHTMAPCAPAVMRSKAIAILPAPLVSGDVGPLFLLAPPSIDTPPEPPPPRA